jgi:predicted GNAT family N-acyltransferase
MPDGTDLICQNDGGRWLASNTNTLPQAVNRRLLTAASLALRQDVSIAPSLPARVTVARLAPQLASIWRLRYDVYVAEQGRTVRGADHQSKQLADEFDAGAVHLCIERDAVTLAAVRLHLGPVPEGLAAPLKLDQFRGLRPRDCCVISKLMVRREARGSRATIDLLRALYRICLAARMKAVFCTTFPDLVRLYSRMGFEAYGGDYTDSSFGPHHTLVAYPEQALRNERLRWLRRLSAGRL